MLLTRLIAIMILIYLNIFNDNHLKCFLNARNFFIKYQVLFKK
jgi:hypothetical protein